MATNRRRSPSNIRLRRRCDLDGAVDLYCGQSDGEPPDALGQSGNELFRQLQSGFATVAAVAGVNDRGYCAGVTAGDLNQDGFPDVVVGNLGVNRILINQGDGTFRDGSSRVAWTESHYTIAMAIADVSGDGIPDIIEVNYVNDPKSVAAADFDANGMIDLMITNWIDEWNNLFLQLTPGNFRDAAPVYRLDRVSEGILGFGTQAVDYDNDTRIDALVVNGHIDDFSHTGIPFKMPTQLLVNCGDHFENAR